MSDIKPFKTLKTHTKLHFSVQDDIKILKKVIELNPYKNMAIWKTIREYICCVQEKNFSLRAVREHVEYLLKLYRKNDFNNLKK